MADHRDTVYVCFFKDQLCRLSPDILTVKHGDLFQILLRGWGILIFF